MLYRRTGHDAVSQFIGIEEIEALDGYYGDIAVDEVGTCWEFEMSEVVSTKEIEFDDDGDRI